MAKKSKSHYSRSPQRDFTNPNRYRSAMLEDPLYRRAQAWTRPEPFFADWMKDDDRRQFSPVQKTPFVNVVTSSPARVQPRRATTLPKLFDARWQAPVELKRIRGVPYGLEVRNPLRITNCIRRHIRREVLFALGRGGSNPGPRHRNEASEVHC